MDNLNIKDMIRFTKIIDKQEADIAQLKEINKQKTEMIKQLEVENRHKQEVICRFDVLTEGLKRTVDKYICKMRKYSGKNNR